MSNSSCDPGRQRPELDDFYDRATMLLIEAGSSRSSGPALESTSPPGGRAKNRSVRSRTAGLALATSLVTGVAEVFAPEAEEVFEEVDDGVAGDAESFVQLFYVPHDPRATLAIVRPWLAPR